MAAIQCGFLYLGFFAIYALCQDLEYKSDPKVVFLENGDVISVELTSRHRGFFENELRTFCYRGNKKSLGRFFETIEMQLKIEGDDYSQYEGDSPEEVAEHYDEHRSIFSFNVFSPKRKSKVQLHPFLQKCIGITAMKSYEVCLQQHLVDFWCVIQLLVGLFLLYSAARLSHNDIFYYITGISLGICSSFLLIIWLASRLIPRRKLMYGFLIGGWSIGIYLFQRLWENMKLILVVYRNYVLWYIIITGILSFFFCYRLGPPKNARSKKIIQWLLQLMGLTLMFFSSSFEEASGAVIILSVIYMYFPRTLLYKLRAWYLRRFPPARSFLSNEEYYHQGVVETTKALKQLREYAHSPDCKQWKLMTQLSNPMRFAGFVEGDSHLSDEEILEFENSKIDSEDDSDIDDDEEEQDNNYYQSQLRRPLNEGIRSMQSLTMDISDDEEFDNEHNRNGRRQYPYYRNINTSLT